MILLLLVGLHNSMAVYTRKCKEAEKSSLNFMKFLQNINCTLLDGHKKVQTGFESIHHDFKTQVENFKKYLGMNRIEPVKEDKLDYDINVRSLDPKDDVQKVTKRDTEDASVSEDGKKQTVPSFYYKNILFAATRPMDEENPEEATIGLDTFNIFLAPNKCRKNQSFIQGRCRTIV